MNSKLQKFKFFDKLLSSVKILYPNALLSDSYISKSYFVIGYNYKENFFLKLKVLFILFGYVNYKSTNKKNQHSNFMKLLVWFFQAMK